MANKTINLISVGGTTNVFGGSTENFIFTSSGPTTMLSNYLLTTMGNISNNRSVSVHWKARIDITTNNTHIFLFGIDIPQNQLDRDGMFEFTWDGTSWNVMYFPDFQETEFITPEKLVPSLNTREITARVSYNTTLSNLTYTLINPYNNAKLEKIYIKEYETLDDYGFIEIDHGLGGFAPFILYTSATNGITLASPDKLKIPLGMTAGSYGEIGITTNYVQYQTDPFWQIGLSGPATLGSLELTFVFTILE